MRNKKLILSIFSVIALAFGSITLWLTELLWTVGWQDSNWLWASQYAVFGINFFIVAAYLLPVRHLLGRPWSKLWMPGLELYFIAIIAFFITKSILYSLFLPLTVFDLSPYVLWLMLAALLLTSAGSVYYLTRNYLYPVKIVFVPAIITVEAMAAILSLLTAYLLFDDDSPGPLLLAAVKAGLPFFYFTLLMGLFSILSILRLRPQEQRESREEILDDVEFPE